jgi:hypothetical protein
MGKPDAKAHRQSQPLLSLAMGGMLLSLSLHAVVIRSQQRGHWKGGGQWGSCRRQSKTTPVVLPHFLYGRGGEDGRGHASMVAPIVISWVGTLLLLSFPNCNVVVLCSFFLLDRGGRGSLMRKHVDGCTHYRLLQGGARCCRCLSPPSSYGCDNVNGRREEGNRDCLGGGSNQGQHCLRSPFLLDSRGGEAGRGSVSRVSPIVVSCNRGHVAVIVSPRRCCTVATTRMVEGGRATGIAQEAIKDDSSHAPSFFCMPRALKPDAEAGQWLHPLSSPGTGAHCRCSLSTIAL